MLLPGPHCLLLFGIFACEPADDGATGGLTSTTTAAAPASPTLELGTGIAAWEDLPEGGSIELVAGFQGGWHVDISVRGEDLDPVDLWLHYQALDAETEEPLSFVTHALLGEDNTLRSGEGWSRLGDRIVFDIAGPEAVVDREVCILVTAESEAWTGEDRRCVRVVDREP